MIITANSKLNSFTQVVTYPSFFENLIIHSVKRQPSDISRVNCEMTMECGENPVPKLPKCVRFVLEGVPKSLKSIDIAFNGQKFYAIAVKEDKAGDEIHKIPIRVIEEKY